MRAIPLLRSRRALGLAVLPLICLLLLPAPAAAAPPLAAGNAIVLDVASGRALFARASDEVIAPASLTKIMTALVALEHAAPAKRLAIVPGDIVGEASMGLRAGENLSLETLLYGLLLPSGNDAAIAIARGVGAQPGDASGAEGIARFVGWMNERAAGLGLSVTHYVNPHGLDADNHLSSAADLARLTGVAWANPTFARIFGSASYTGEGHSMRHGNRLIGQYDGVVGGKVGLTDGCGFCLITAAEHAGHRLVVVVLRDTREGAFADTTALLDWAYAQLDTGAFAAPIVAPPPAATPPPTMPTAATSAATPATASRQASAPAATPTPGASRAVGTLGGGFPTEHTPPWEEHRTLLIAAFAVLCSWLIVRRIFG